MTEPQSGPQADCAGCSGSGCHWPGWVPAGQFIVTPEPSWLRTARMPAATTRPTRTLDGDSKLPPLTRSPARRASRVGWYSGKSATRVSWAAWAAAAGIEASRGAFTSNRYGSYDWLMELTVSKTAACTMARAREALPGLFCRGWASRLSFFRASRAMAFHSRTTSADGTQRSSNASTLSSGRTPPEYLPRRPPCRERSHAEAVVCHHVLRIGASSFGDVRSH